MGGEAPEPVGEGAIRRGVRHGMNRLSALAIVVCLTGAAAVAVLLWAARNRDPRSRAERLLEEAERRIRELERLVGP